MSLLNIVGLFPGSSSSPTAAWGQRRFNVNLGVSCHQDKERDGPEYGRHGKSNVTQWLLIVVSNKLYHASGILQRFRVKLARGC